MKAKSLVSVLAFIAGLGLSARAQTVSVGIPDLVVGFQGSVGGANDYEANIGSIDNYIENFGFPIGQGFSDVLIPLSGNISVTDLTGIFGAGWWNTVTFGGAATSNGTVWFGNSDYFVASLAPGGSSPSNFFLPNPSSNAILGLYGTLNGAPASPNTANPNTAAEINASLTGSWTQLADQGGNHPLVITSRLPGYLAVDIWAQTPPGSSAFLYDGTLELSDSGELFYTNYVPSTTAIPEPSMYATILGTAMLGLVMLRRRKQRHLVA